MPSLKPSGPPAVRMFNVGFGDCFVLSIPYPDRSRHVLIDFGSKPKPKTAPGNLMEEIARNIAAVCGGKLDAVVATHRHADHISGFGGKSGKIIAGLKPTVVVQPWTEHPDAATNATKAPAFLAVTRSYMRGLREAGRFGRMLAALPENRRLALGKPLAKRLQFAGENAISNKAAVKNLMTMGQQKPVYVNFGSKSGLESVLPGVKIHVLGPPTVEQSKTIQSYAKSSPDYWLRQQRGLLAIADLVARSQARRRLFPRATPVSIRSANPQARWFIQRIRQAAADEVRSIVTELDDVLNNTSVILLFQIGSKKLLFPGDAQLENWSYALHPDRVKPYKKLLEQVDLYKVGHHGSLNATPKRLWDLFVRRSGTASSTRLKSAMSTMPGVHGGKHGKPTEVPRSTLVDALKSETKFETTQGKPANSQPVLIEF